MAYFAFEYVNTDYDEDSATAPVEGEVNAILNVVYDVRDEISSSIVNLHYDVNEGTTEVICNFNSNIKSDLEQKRVDVPLNVSTAFENSILKIKYTVEEPTFLNSSLHCHYNVARDDVSAAIFIKRDGLDD